MKELLKYRPPMKKLLKSDDETGLTTVNPLPSSAVYKRKQRDWRFLARKDSSGMLCVSVCVSTSSQVMETSREPPVEDKVVYRMNY